MVEVEGWLSGRKPRLPGYAAISRFLIWALCLDPALSHRCLNSSDVRRPRGVSSVRACFRRDSLSMGLLSQEQQTIAAATTAAAVAAVACTQCCHGVSGTCTGSRTTGGDRLLLGALPGGERLPQPCAHAAKKLTPLTLFCLLRTARMTFVLDLVLFRIAIEVLVDWGRYAYATCNGVGELHQGYPYNDTSTCIPHQGSPRTDERMCVALDTGTLVWVSQSKKKGGADSAGDLFSRAAIVRDPFAATPGSAAYAGAAGGSGKRRVTVRYPQGSTCAGDGCSHRSCLVQHSAA